MEILRNKMNQNYKLFFRFCRISIFIFHILPLAFCLVSLNMNAQLVQWDWIVSAEGALGDWGNNIILDNNNNLLVTGRYNGTLSFGSTTLPNSGFHTGIFFTKLDSSGNFLWSESGYTDYFVWANSATKDENNNIYLAGYYKTSLIIDTIELNNYWQFDPFISSFSPSGELKWLKQLHGEGEGFASFISYNDGELYVAGVFADTLFVDTNSIISNGNDDVFFAKYDTLGNIIWLKNIVSSPDFDNVKSICSNSQASILITGVFNNVADFEDTTMSSFGNSDGFIMKKDSSGVTKWLQQFGGTSLDGGLSVCTDSNGNNYIEGIFNGTALLGDTSLIAVGGLNFFLAKFNPDGEFIWARRMLIECNINDDLYFNSITCDNDGNLYMTAWFALDFQFDGITLTSAGNYDSFVMKLSPDGDALWAMQLSSPGYVHSRSITNDSNGNLYITGWFNDIMTYGDSTITPYGGADVFIAKLHEEPVSVSYNETTAMLEISVYPNPATEYVNIGNAEKQIEKAEIIGMNGKLIRTFNNNLNRLDVAGLVNGTYILKIYGDRSIFVTKIVIQ